MPSIALAADGPASPGNRFGTLLQAYFRSGWAFLIPYLAAYLLYAWLRWPVSAVTGEGWRAIIESIGAPPTRAPHEAEAGSSQIFLAGRSRRSIHCLDS